MNHPSEIVHTDGIDWFRMKPALREAAGLPADAYVDIEAMHLCPGTGADGPDVNSAALGRITGWMLSQGFQEFRVVGREYPYGLQLRTIHGAITVDPGGWVMLNAVGFYGATAEGFAQIFDPV